MASNVQLLVADKLQSEGRAYFKKEQYSAAISKFSEAIDMRPVTLLSLLDNRAATYEKMDKLTDALKDAKAMIQHEKGNPKGYLRAGKVLVLMQKLEVALGIYRHGLQRIETTNPSYALLQKMYTKIQEQENARLQKQIKNKYDPFAVLPLELLEMVMRYLPFTQLVACQRVAKTWKNTISTNGPFWRDLDFSSARKKVKTKSLLSCVKNSHYTLTRVTVNQMTTMEGNTLVEIARLCQDLSYLRVVDGSLGASLNLVIDLAHNLKTLILHCEITYTALVRILQPEVRIEHLECSRIAPFKVRQSIWSDKPCTSFRKVILNSSDITPKPQRNFHLDVLLKTLPELQEFSISCASMMPEVPVILPINLESFTCRHSIIHLCLPLPGNLTHLDLGHSNIFLVPPEPGEPLDTQPALTYLNLANTKIKLSHLIEFIGGHPESLKTLDLSWTYRLNYEEVENVYIIRGLFSCLEKLAVEGLHEFGDSNLEKLAKLSNIKSLNTSLTSITGAGILSFQKQFKGNITELYLDHCSNVSPSLIQHLRAKGILVSNKQQTQRNPRVIRDIY